MSPMRREEIKQAIIDALRPFGVRRIALFGSFARDKAGPQSDVDILVSFWRHGTRAKSIGLRWFSLDQEISAKIGYPVDLVTEDSLPRALRQIIEKDLEIIYE